MFGRRSPAIGALIGIGAVAFVIGLMLVGPSLGLGGDWEVKTDTFNEPIGATTSARVNLDLSSAPPGFPLQRNGATMSTEETMNTSWRYNMEQHAAHSPPHRHLWSGLSSDAPTAEVGILGVPFDNATSFRKGAAFAPARIRALTPHVAPATEEGHPLAGLRVRDYGDVPLDLNWERYFATVEAQAAQALRHPFALFLGGDHSVTIPLVAAFSRTVSGSFGVVHFDAHPDLGDVYEGHRWAHACTERRVLELPNVAPQHLAFVGLRSWMAEELEFLAAHPEVGVHTARDVYRRGVEAVAEAVVAQLAGVAAVYFTLDIDGLDPACAPGTGTPEAGGLSTRELLELLRVIIARLPVRALDIVEVAPPLDNADVTSFAAIKVIYEVLGWVKWRSRRSRTE
jgi:agmatinase